MQKRIQELLRDGYVLPEVTADIPHGDMPGDKIGIDEGHVKKAGIIFPELLKQLKDCGEKAVIAVAGGSGVGKSEIASILGWYLSALGIMAYVLSGDNYPRRIPMYNDAERLSTFRTAGIRGMLLEGVFLSRERASLSELDPARILEAFLRRLWGDAIRRRLGELPARGDAELERRRLSLLMRMKRIKSAPWTVAHTFMTDAL